MKTGLASQKKLSAPAVDFPRINESYTGRLACYVLLVITESLGLLLSFSEVTVFINKVDTAKTQHCIPPQSMEF